MALAHKASGRPDYQAVRIHCHSVRKRLVDPDAVSIKAALDGIVEAGVIEDDKAEFVKEISFSQEKGSDEKTIITIDVAEGH